MPLARSGKGNAIPNGVHVCHDMCKEACMCELGLLKVHFAWS